MKRLLVIFLLSGSFSSVLLNAQRAKIDSLKGVLIETSADTQKVNILTRLARAYKRIRIDSSLYYTNQALLLAQKSESSNDPVIAATGKYQVAKCYHNRSDYLMKKGDYASSIDDGQKAVTMYQELKAQKYEGDVHYIMAISWFCLGDFRKSLDEHFSAIHIAEDLKDSVTLASNYSGIAGVYYSQHNFDKALEYSFLSLNILKAENDSAGIATNLGNIGNIYSDKGNNKQALEFYRQSQLIDERVGNKEGMAVNYGNMSDVYDVEGDLDTALLLCRKALDICREVGNLGGTARHLGHIGAIYHKMHAYALSEDYLKQSLAISDSIGELDISSATHLDLSDLYSETRQWQSAYDHYKLYSEQKDSLTDLQATSEIEGKVANYEYQKKNLKDSLQRVALEENHRQEIKQQKIYTYCGGGGIFLMGIIALVLLRNYRNKQKINAILGEKNREILDSITYAKRLQDAILPSPSLFTEKFSDNFVFFRPKDIVAGDFYFLEERPGHIILAAADCTGHGVPGAMVSVVCSNALTRAVKEFGLVDPGKILDTVRDLVVETFDKSGSDVKDGMDISLLVISDGGKTVKWAGANNPLWYMHGGELHEIAADRQPVGRHEFPAPFTTHSITIDRNEPLYLFTDGIPDQFGGPKGKKFKYRQLQELLLKNASRPMKEQKELLIRTIDEWMNYSKDGKGGYEQTDDMLMIGIRIN